MSYYTPSVALDHPGSVVSQPTSQALVLANPSARAVQYQSSAAIPIPASHNSYMYGSYGSYSQPAQYGYPQSMPVYVQPQQQVVYTMPTNMPTYSAVPSYGSSYGYGYNTAPQYVPGMGGTSTVIVQDPYGYSRRRSRRRRHSHSGYGTYGY